jgi:hypothetical protein
MKILFEMKYKHPGRKVLSPVMLNGSLVVRSFCQSEMTIEYGGKNYRAFNMLLLAEEEQEIVE